MPRVSLASIPSEPAPPPRGDRAVSWSPQQLAVFDAVTEANRNLIVEAVAGSGKTTSLVGACERMKGPVAFCAYNKRIADEIKFRVSHLPLVTAGTFHSFGFAAVRGAASPSVVGSKLGDIQAELRQPQNLQSAARFLCSLAKQTGLGAQGFASATDQAAWEALISHFDVGADLELDSGGLLIECAAALLHRSNASWTETIDFDDMLYLPLLLQLPLRKYSWVLVDEAQDTNPVRRAFAHRMLAPEGRLVAVGDRHQAIYGFTGADNDALDIIASEFSCTNFPLTVTYRCPQAVVRHAHQWVSHIEAADTAPEGIVRTIPLSAFRKLGADALGEGDAVLCRYTRPCVDEALRLIRRGIGARVEGRDIGQGLITLTKRWKTVCSLDDLADHLDDYRKREVDKALAKHNELQASSIQDKVDTLLCIIESMPAGSNVWDLQGAITKLFGDTEPGTTPKVVVFSTVHKAKGREWDRVYILGRETFMPSKWAAQDWQREQERNLIYVAVTRTKHELIEVDFSGEGK